MTGWRVAIAGPSLEVRAVCPTMDRTRIGGVLVARSTGNQGMVQLGRGEGSHLVRDKSAGRSKLWKSKEQSWQAIGAPDLRKTTVVAEDRKCLIRTYNAGVTLGIAIGPPIR